MKVFVGIFMLLSGCQLFGQPVLSILTASRTGDVTLQVSGCIPGRNYEVQATENLLSPDWQSVNTFTATDELNQVTLAGLWPDHGFFRVYVPPLPVANDLAAIGAFTLGLFLAKLVSSPMRRL